MDPKWEWNLSGNGRCLVGGSRRTRSRRGGDPRGATVHSLLWPRVGGKFVLGACHSRWLQRYVPRPVRMGCGVFFACLFACSFLAMAAADQILSGRVPHGRLWHTLPRQSTTELPARPGADMGESRRRCGRGNTPDVAAVFLSVIAESSAAAAEAAEALPRPNAVTAGVDLAAITSGHGRRADPPALICIRTRHHGPARPGPW
jgi:hypothetical protein